MQLRPLLASALLLLPLGASAVSISSSPESVSMVQKNDRYEFGNNVSLTAPFTGDVFAAGQTVTIDEPVSGNLQVAGQTVIVNTTVGGNLRVAGGQVIIRGTVNGSVLAVGGTVTLQEGAQVRGDLSVFGGKVELNGAVGGDVYARGENISVRTIAGSADLRGSDLRLQGAIAGSVAASSEHEFSLAPGATIGGNLRYWSGKGNMDTALDSSVSGDVMFDETLQWKKDAPHDAAAFGAVFAGLVGVYSLLSTAFILLIVLSLMSKSFGEAAKLLQKHPWQSLLVSLLFFIGMPILAMLLLFTIIGIPVAALVVFKFIAGILLCRVLASVVLVRWLELHRKAKWGGWTVGALSLLCYVLLNVINIVPVIGWMLSCALVLMGFGALLTVMTEKIRKVL